MYAIRSYYALHGALDQRPHIGLDLVDAVVPAQPLVQLGIEMSAHLAEIVVDAFAVALERVHVAEDHADGVVQLVGDPRHQTAERGHLLRMDP